MKYEFRAGRLITFIIAGFTASFSGLAQGTWSRIAASAPDPNSGTMVLLPNGNVMVKTGSGGGDGYGNMWDLLSPDAHGSYVNGTWNVTTPMNDTRLYFSTQVLKNGRVYVAGGEYGSGKATAELYDPLNDVWQYISVPPGDTIYDASSEMLPDGKVLQAVDYDAGGGFGAYGHSTIIFDPATNTYSFGTPTAGWHSEASWVKLPDNTILFIDWQNTTSERYDPVSGVWITDANVPVNIYDTVANETGPAILLPNGKAMVFGGDGKTAIYTPSGTLSPGTWVAGPTMPSGMSMPDAPASVMPDGKVLLTTSPIPHGMYYFPSPTSFYVFDYRTDSFTRIAGPFGIDTMGGPCFVTHMLNLPDGSTLFSIGSATDYFVYTPSDTAMPAGKPTIDNVIKINCDTFMAVGKLFNGLNEGSYYGDDWQMSTNFPLVRLTQSGNVYYTTTYNWNRTGVMTGNLEDTTYFILPAGLAEGTYSLQLVANGISSASRTFKTCKAAGIEELAEGNKQMLVYPDPASSEIHFTFPAEDGSYTLRVQDMLGRIVIEQPGKSLSGRNELAVDISRLPAGVYAAFIVCEHGSLRTTFVVEK